MDDSAWLLAAPEASEPEQRWIRLKEEPVVVLHSRVELAEQQWHRRLSCSVR